MAAPAGHGLDPSTEVQVACSDARASRLDVVAVLLASGAGVLGPSVRRPRAVGLEAATSAASTTSTAA